MNEVWICPLPGNTYSFGELNAFYITEQEQRHPFQSGELEYLFYVYIYIYMEYIYAACSIQDQINPTY